jgi:hypothetical protein
MVETIGYQLKARSPVDKGDQGNEDWDFPSLPMFASVRLYDSRARDSRVALKPPGRVMVT